MNIEEEAIVNPPLEITDNTDDKEPEMPGGVQLNRDYSFSTLNTHGLFE